MFHHENPPPLCDGSDGIGGVHDHFIDHPASLVDGNNASANAPRLYLASLPAGDEHERRFDSVVDDGATTTSMAPVLPPTVP